ncbi:MAG: hypothetical protein M3O65_05775 [Actinomycetota bacterium]|nr:hypothetical protein [Actinomycetota bacterium]
MPNSQIEMVVKGDEDGRERWFVCGRIEAGTGRAASRPVDLLAVVRQGDVVARGHATRPFGRWVFEVVPEGDAQLTVTKQGAAADDRAVSSSLAILEEPRPGGFQWEQVLEIREVVDAPE